MRLRPPFGSIKAGMFGTPGRALFEPENFAPRFGMRLGASAKQKSMELFIEEMDAAGITLGAVPIRKGTHMRNEDLQPLLEQYPNRFVGVAGIDPHQGDACLREIETHVLHGCARGIIVEPGFCAPALYAHDKKIYPIYDFCQTHSIPCCVSFGGFVAPDMSYTDPQIIERIALDFPKLTLIVSHGGWPHVAQICHVAFEREGVYLAPDLYTMNVPGHQDYRQAVNYLIPEKLLFGTAYPCVDMGDAVRYALQWGVREDVLERYMYRNAAAIFAPDTL